MKIKYCRKRLSTNIFFCASWVLLGIVQWNLNHDSVPDFTLFSFVTALFYLADFLIKICIPYCSVKENSIQKNYPFRSTIYLDDLLEMNITTDNIRLIGSNHSITISKYKIDRNSLTPLKKYLNLHSDHISNQVTRI